MTNNYEWINKHGQALRTALETYLATGVEADYDYLVSKATELTTYLCRLHHLQPARREAKVRDMTTRLLPEWVQRKGTWESFVKEVLYSVAVAEDEQFTIRAGQFDDERTGGYEELSRPKPPAPPVPDPPPDLTNIAEDAAKSVTRDFFRMMSEFNECLYRGASPVYSMIKSDPERHSALLALFIILEPELFEQFIREYGGTTFRVPSADELDRYRRDQEIIRARHQGLTGEQIGKTMGLSASSVSQIATAQRRLRRSDPELDKALIGEMNRWARVSQRAIVKKLLR